MSTVEEVINMQFLRMNDVVEKIKVAASTIDLYVKRGDFPVPLKTSEKVKVWLETDIEKWMQQHIDNANKE